MKIFCGGSKVIKNLPDEALKELDGYLKIGAHILVGDCYGVDLCVQNFLSACGYESVTIYCSGDKPRYNVGKWEEKALNERALSGYEFYRVKDAAMARDCDSGFMVWNGESRGTEQNIKRLKSLNKPIKIIMYENSRRNS